MSDFSGDTFWTYLIKSVLIVLFLLTSVIIAIWFERRVIGRMQVRPGPNVNGPFGLLQTVYDAGKLLLKEDITVKAADKVVYILAPMISVFTALLVFAVIPMGPEVRIPFTDIVTPLQLTDFPVATLYVLACAAVGVYGIVLGGWSSGSTYPLIGAVRSSAQIISYELGMGLSLVSVFIMAGSMSTGEIVGSQEQIWWFLPLMPAFLIYIISMMGEVNRLPFDLPEAEGELVAGYSTEYSSMKFAWFYLAEYINMLNVSAVATTLFLGGWRAPWPISAINDGMFNEGWWGLLWFLVKVWGMMFFFVWVRGTLLRFRYDQFMVFGWKVLIPFALAWIVILAVFQGIQQFNGMDARPVLFVVAGVAAIVLIISLVLETKANTKRAALEAEQNAKPREAQEFDAFADGFPVPPKPGQTLPPSPRAARRAAQAQASPSSAPVTLSQIETKHKEAGDD